MFLNYQLYNFINIEYILKNKNLYNKTTTTLNSQNHI